MKEETLFSKLPTLISVLGALVLSLSIAYDYGYFLVFGVSFAEMPTTLSDHLRSSLTWIPSTLLVIFGVFILELFNRRVEQGMTEEEIIQSSPNPKFTAWFRDSLKYPIIAVALFAPLTLFLNIDLPIQAWQFSSIIIWFIIHNFLFGHKRIIERSTKEFYMLSRWIPAALIFVVFNGAIAANKIKEGNGSSYVIELEKAKITRVLARTFDKYYMLWDNEKETVALLSTGKVVSLYPEPVNKEANKKIQPTPNSGAAD